MDAANVQTAVTALVGRVHRAGLKALLDFVSDHVARSYHSVVKPELDFGTGDDTGKFFAPNNHFFYLINPSGQKLTLSKPASWNPSGVKFDGKFALEDGSVGHPPKATGNNVTSPNPGVDDWYDTIKLNYGYNFVDRTGHYHQRPRTWDLIDHILAYWQAKGVDGFRCDFANYVPAEVWTFLIDKARQRDTNAFFLRRRRTVKGPTGPSPVLRRFAWVMPGFFGSGRRLPGVEVLQPSGALHRLSRSLQLCPFPKRFQKSVGHRGYTRQAAIRPNKHRDIKAMFIASCIRARPRSSGD